MDAPHTRFVIMWSIGVEIGGFYGEVLSVCQQDSEV